MRSKLVIVAFTTMTACVVAELDLTGRECPCLAGWQCDAARNLCVQSLVDGGGAFDAGNDGSRETGPARVYVVGGVTADGATQEILVSTLGNDGELSPWQPAGQLLPVPLTNFAIPDGIGLLTIGGGSSVPIPQAYFFARDSDGTLTPALTSKLDSGPVWHHAAVFADGSVFVIGGILGGSGALTRRVIAIPFADGSLGSSTSAASLPSPLAYHCALSAAGSLYVIGGKTPPDGGGGGNALVQDVLRARVGDDGGVPSWETAVSLPEGRASHRCVLHDGRIYVVAGAGGRDVLTSQVDDAGALSPWVQARVLPSFDDGGGLDTVLEPAVVVYRDTLILMGGLVNNVKPSPSVFTAKIDGDGGLEPWTAGPPLPSGRSGMGAVVLP